MGPPQIFPQKLSVSADFIGVLRDWLQRVAMNGPREATLILFLSNAFFGSPRISIEFGPMDLKLSQGSMRQRF